MTDVCDGIHVDAIECSTCLSTCSLAPSVPVCKNVSKKVCSVQIINGAEFENCEERVVGKKCT